MSNPAAMTFDNAKQRFSTRVADYARYRPGYPAGVVDLLRSECGLRPEHVVADVGSGTGFLSELFLANGNRVFGVEPNKEMREAGEALVGSHAGFTSVDGSAEATGLEDKSVDFVTAGQAFHWFQRDPARREFSRVLRPGGWCVFLWNDRQLSLSDFGREYEELLVRYGTDYLRVREAYPEAGQMQEFFGPGNVVCRELANFQDLDLAGLAGRLRSSSYAPQEGHASYAPMVEALGRIFEKRNVGGRVRMEYRTQVYFGRLDGTGNAG